MKVSSPSPPGPPGAEVRSFQTRVRMSELGPQGQVWPHRVLEWMQEAAAFASSEAGYPPCRYRAMGAAWFVREVLLSIRSPVEYGETICVQTWVSDLRRFRSRREYRVVAADDRLVAAGQADWFLLSFSGKGGAIRPLRPDDEMRAAFPRCAEHAMDSASVPVWPDSATSKDVHRIERVVRPLEMDHNGHVNHVHHLAWFEDHALGLGAGPLLRVRLFYENDARAGEQVGLSCALIEGGTYHEACRGIARLARAVVCRG